jgi:hypothetical protein
MFSKRLHRCRGFTDIVSGWAASTNDVARVYVDTIRRDHASDAGFIVEKHDRKLRTLASRSRLHALCDIPDDAEIILLYDPLPLHAWTGDYFQRGVLAHPLAAKHPQRTFVYDISDFPIPRARGIYASADAAWYDQTRHRSGPYLHYLLDDRAAVTDSTDPPDLLYSFVGDTTTHPLRAELATLSHRSGLVVNTSRQAPWLGGDRRSYLDGFTATMSRSRFVLCPRGRGVASMRLFETMMLGRVPVIISDWWVPVAGPKWSSFSVRVSEKDVSRIPAILQHLAERAKDMGRNARVAWEQWFGPNVLFDRLINWCIELRDSPCRRCTPNARHALGLALAVLEAVPRTSRLAQTIKRRLI